ncbi:MAG: hypothetical protein AB1513_02900 [Pseudomonadota bacterium]
MQPEELRLKEFIDLYEEEYGVRLSESKARIASEQLIRLIEILSRPLPLPSPSDHQVNITPPS